MLGKQIAWLPSQIEILTDIGWVPIPNLYSEWANIKVFTHNSRTGKREWQQVKSMSKRKEFTGELTRITTDTQVIDFHTAFVLDKHDVFPSFDPTPNINHVRTKIPYSGPLFNVDVANGIVFLRTPVYPNSVSRKLLMVDDRSVNVYDELEKHTKATHYHDVSQPKKRRTSSANGGRSKGRYLPITPFDYWVCQVKW